MPADGRWNLTWRLKGQVDMTDCDSKRHAQTIMQLEQHREVAHNLYPYSKRYE